ncbi:MAG: polymer-forming cytoskeletal protein [Prevotellaceae bacterium]|nr:polymer-forming cytoskeletal protein [Prevotellaceae bacterium]
MAKELVVPTGASYNALTFGSKIVGKIEADSDFRIDGIVEGDINCKGKVIIGQKGYLKGSIVCVNAEVVGTVIGNFLVSEMLTLRSTANITGDVKTKVLAIEPKAVFNGVCSMTGANVNTNALREGSGPRENSGVRERESYREEKKLITR